MNLKKYLIILFTALFAAAAISAFAADKKITKMEKNIASKNPKTRAQAASSLAKAGSKESLSKLVAQLEAEKNDGVRARLIDSIAQLGGQDALGVLIKSLKEDSSANVRALVCLKLGMIKDASAKDALVEVFNNKAEDINVRNSAASALLSHMDDGNVYKILENTIKSDDQILKLGIINSLRGFVRTEKGRRLLLMAEKDRDETASGLAKSVLKQ